MDESRGAMSFEEVRATLPQKYPFIFIDRVLELEAGKRILCLKNVTGNEAFFSGHFPDFAVMPGALILEALAQATILLFKRSSVAPADPDTLFLFGGVKGRMLKPVFPGDQLRLEVTVNKLISTGALTTGVVTVDGEAVVKAELSFGLAKRDSLRK
ncbi:MAG TPA: 3-hydroxyacyl-ACP dehydratase FabZ [Blastocatellia bacterium]|nr:3-hydroxyacyl-ACP dehydratase FabZ [Blastocatellia bacterium]